MKEPAMTQPTDQAITDDELRLLEGLLAKLSGRSASLPAPVFRFVTEVSATVNVDLLVRDGEKRVLLAWRDDPFGTGWHVPGSIIRHREDIAHRISACAQDEFGCAVDAAEQPVAALQIFDDRGHSVSLCFLASLRGHPGKRLVEEDAEPRHGDLCWFAALPSRLYPSHRIYRDLLAALDSGHLGQGARLFTQHTGRRDAEQASAEGVIRADTSLT
jgi:colanic acid biosynthesis protein WcaH